MIKSEGKQPILSRLLNITKSSLKDYGEGKGFESRASQKN